MKNTQLTNEQIQNIHSANECLSFLFNVWEQTYKWERSKLASDPEISVALSELRQASDKAEKLILDEFKIKSPVKL